MCKPHKHAAIIKAWADGAKVEVECYDGIWQEVAEPSWNAEHYRIKPEPKPDFTIRARVSHALSNYPSRNTRVLVTWTDHERSNVIFTYDGETGSLKQVQMI